MKIYLISLLAAAGLSLEACSQRLTSRDTPALVQNTLEARFPYAAEVEWEKKDGLFEAEFLKEQREHSVLIDTAGTVRMVKLAIPAAELPAAITRLLASAYGGFALDDTEIIEKGDEIFYQVELEKGLRELNLVFTANGRQTDLLPYWD